MREKGVVKKEERRGRNLRQRKVMVTKEKREKEMEKRE